MTPWGCHTDVPVPHPWHPIQDVACGYDGRVDDARCAGCHRRREESALDQLRRLDGVGDAQRAKER